jgi:hypothetical protein
MKRRLLTLAAATALAAACCRNPAPSAPSRSAGPSKPSLVSKPDPTTIREVVEAGLDEPFDRPHFMNACLAQVGERYNLSDEAGFLGAAVIREPASCGQCGCPGVWISLAKPLSRSPVGMIVAFGPVHDDFPTARVIPPEGQVNQPPLLHPEWTWSVWQAVDLDGDGHADALHYRVLEGCSTGFERYCELTQVRVQGEWRVVDTFPAEEPEFGAPFPESRTLYVSRSHLAKAMSDFKADFPSKATGSLNGAVAWPDDVTHLFEILAANYEVAPETGTGATISRDGIRREITTWYLGLSPDEQYRFLSLLARTRRLRIAANLAASLPSPEGMTALPADTAP